MRTIAGCGGGSFLSGTSCRNGKCDAGSGNAKCHSATLLKFAIVYAIFSVDLDIELRHIPLSVVLPRLRDLTCDVKFELGIVRIRCKNIDTIEYETVLEITPRTKIDTMAPDSTTIEMTSLGLLAAGFETRRSTQNRIALFAPLNSLRGTRRVREAR